MAPRVFAAASAAAAAAAAADRTCLIRGSSIEVGPDEWPSFFVSAAALATHRRTDSGGSSLPVEHEAQL